MEEELKIYEKDVAEGRADRTKAEAIRKEAEALRKQADEAKAEANRLSKKIRGDERYIQNKKMAAGTNKNP